MPSKVALTPAEWREKLLAVLPPWVLEDVEASVLSAHLAGAAAVLSSCEQDAYDHIDETFIERCSEETLRAHMSERIIPELGYTGEGLRRQVQSMWNRLDITQLEIVINDLLTDDEATIELGVTETDHIIIPIDYQDDRSEVVSMATQPNLFNVIIDAVDPVSWNYVDRAEYADYGVAYAGYSGDQSTLELARKIARALDFYKAAGIRYRISKRSPGATPPPIPVDNT